MDTSKLGVRITDRFGRWVARGKDVVTGEWVVGTYMSLFEELHFKNGFGVTDFRKIDTATVGQRLMISSHGQEDKYVFEGDVDDNGFIVTFVGRKENDDGSATGMDIGWYLQRDNFSSYSQIVIGEDITIVGNIIDDPELPEKMKDERYQRQIDSAKETI
jgi:hypothetical protein